MPAVSSHLPALVRERRTGYLFQVNPNGARWDALRDDLFDNEQLWEDGLLGTVRTGSAAQSGRLATRNVRDFEDMDIEVADPWTAV